MPRHFTMIFMDQKEEDGPWLHLVGCAHLGCPRTASLLYKYPKNTRTLEASTKYSSSRRRVQNH